MPYSNRLYFTVPARAARPVRAPDAAAAARARAAHAPEMMRFVVKPCIVTVPVWPGAQWPDTDVMLSALIVNAPGEETHVYGSVMSVIGAASATASAGAVSA